MGEAGKAIGSNKYIWPPGRNNEYVWSPNRGGRNYILPHEIQKTSSPQYQLNTKLSTAQNLQNITLQNAVMRLGFRVPIVQTCNLSRMHGYYPGKIFIFGGKFLL